MTLVNPADPLIGDTPKAQKYDITRRGPDGQELVTVSAVSGDEAAAKAFKAGTIIVGVTPHDDVVQIIEAPRPLTLHGNADGMTAADLKAQNLAETDASPGNATRAAEAQALASGTTTNAVGMEGPGKSGTPTVDLPKADTVTAASLVDAKGK